MYKYLKKKVLQYKYVYFKKVFILTNTFNQKKILTVSKVKFKYF